jgi:hypothetical protein
MASAVIVKSTVLNLISNPFFGNRRGGIAGAETLIRREPNVQRDQHGAGFAGLSVTLNLIQGD